MNERSILKRIFRVDVWFPVCFLSLIFVTACTPKVLEQTSRWSGSGEVPNVTAKGLELQKGPSWKSIKEEVQISEQTVGDFIVEDAFVKTVKKDGELVFQSYDIIPSVSKSLIKRAKKLDELKSSIWSRFLLTHPDYSKWKIESQPRVTIAKSLAYDPAVIVRVSSPSGEILAFYLKQNGKILATVSQGSKLVSSDSEAIAYPKGPKRSLLTKVLLFRILQPEGLANMKLEITTQSPIKILADQDLEVSPPDDRFDQIQAFYFSNQILDWFEKKLSFHGPIKLSIVTHVGYPEKTNTAFYFQNQIRLGMGDDVSFSKIPWDPTIVMHETSHSIIDFLSHLPFQGEGGSLNEGFADFFTASFLQSPLIGDSAYKLADYKRTVDHEMKLSEKTGGLYHDSAIVSGFFWSLGKLITEEKSQQLAMHVLNRLGPNSDFNDFSLTLKEQVEETLKDDDFAKAHDLIKERGLL